MARAYIIAALPRTGSYRLCEMLMDAGCGYPQEYGPREDVATWRDFHGFANHRAYFHYFLRAGRSPSGLFGCKLMWPQFTALREDIASYLRITGIGLVPFEAALGSVSIIFLQRRNRLMQAISLYRAMHSGIWSSRVVSERAHPVYDRGGIADALEVIGSNSRLWERFFADHAVRPCRIWYEDLIAGDTDAVFDAIGVDRRPVRPGLLQRQADDESFLWHDRFIVESGIDDEGGTGSAQVSLHAL